MVKLFIPLRCNWGEPVAETPQEEEAPFYTTEVQLRWDYRPCPTGSNSKLFIPLRCNWGRNWLQQGQPRRLLFIPLRCNWGIRVRVAFTTHILLFIPLRCNWGFPVLFLMPELLYFLYHWGAIEVLPFYCPTCLFQQLFIPLRCNWGNAGRQRDSLIPQLFIPLRCNWGSYFNTVQAWRIEAFYTTEVQLRWINTPEIRGEERPFYTTEVQLR